MPLYNMFSTRYQSGMDGWKLVQNIVSGRQREEGEGEGGREGGREGGSLLLTVVFSSVLSLQPSHHVAITQ